MSAFADISTLRGFSDVSIRLLLNTGLFPELDRFRRSLCFVRGNVCSGGRLCPYGENPVGAQISVEKVEICLVLPLKIASFC
jgi:hypothetical protein